MLADLELEADDAEPDWDEPEDPEPDASPDFESDDDPEVDSVFGLSAAGLSAEPDSACLLARLSVR